MGIARFWMLLWLGLAGCDCGGGDGDRSCISAADCRAGEACTDGVCRSRPDAGAPADGRVPGTDACAAVCGTECCGRGERCFRDRCIEDVGTCSGMTACQNDAACVDDVCVRYGTDPVADRDPGCSREPEPLGTFAPEIQCEWPAAMTIDTPGSTSVRVPPLVGDLDPAGDGIPEIVFSTWGGAAPYLPRIRAIRGDDCTPVWTTDYDVDLNQQLALGDLDGDGRPEICGRSSNYTGTTWPFCLRPDGTLFWEGHDAAGRVMVSPGYHDVGINIANVDGAGGPEVVFGLAVFDGATGMLLRAGPEPTRGMGFWNAATPAVANVDADANLEAVTGGRIYDLVTGEVIDWGVSDGVVALAELDGTHDGPEVVVVNGTSNEIRVHAIDGTEIYRHAVPGGAGGAPTVADLDGDGQAEFQIAAQRFLTAFDLDCVDRGAGVDPLRCPTAGATDGVMWSVPTHELSSGITGSSVFDFEGDGAVEVVYGDECWTRIFDGRTGAVKFSTPHESGTGIEYPVVADVDGDFYTEIVAPHEMYATDCPMNDPLFPSATREARRYVGVTVLRDRTDRWAPSRPLWSQHAEHFDQRNDDGTVPRVETASWTTHNSYRRALPRMGGTAIDSPNLTVGDLEAAPCNEAEMTQPLSANVCNRGTLPVAPGVVVAFTRAVAAGTEELCRATTTAALEPGRCERVGCIWSGVPLSDPHDVVAIVDPPDGTITECHEDDNTATLTVQCPPPLG